MSTLQSPHAPRVREVPRRSLLRRGARREVGDYGWNGRVWRRWSGRRWASPITSMQRELLLREATPDTWPTIPRDRLQHGLALVVEQQVTDNGADVAYEGPHGTVVVYRRHVSHVAHALVTLLTGGLWVIVWFGIVLGSRDERRRIEIDSWGHVWAVPLRSR